MYVLCQEKLLEKYGIPRQGEDCLGPYGGEPGGKAVEK
jgi:hypothetical protein